MSLEWTKMPLNKNVEMFDMIYLLKKIYIKRKKLSTTVSIKIVKSNRKGLESRTFNILHQRSFFWAEAAFQRCSYEEVFWKYTANLQENTTPKCDFNKAAKQLYWIHILAWVFSCKFTAYFQNTFSYEHLWTAASGYRMFENLEWC